MFAENVQVLNGEGGLWETARPLLDTALRLDKMDSSSIWHGWQKSQIEAFLAALPSPCSLVVGVWDSFSAPETGLARDRLTLGVVCKVEHGEIVLVGTFEALQAAGLKSVAELAIDMEDGLEIMHYVRRQIAPVGWALFIEKPAWDEWLLSAASDGGALDKGKLLEKLAHRGACVLMGSQATLSEQG